MNPASPCPGCATPGGPCQRSAWQPHCPVSPLPWRLLRPLPLAQQAHSTQSRVHTVTQEAYVQPVVRQHGKQTATPARAYYIIPALCMQLSFTSSIYRSPVVLTITTSIHYQYVPLCSSLTPNATSILCSYYVMSKTSLQSADHTYCTYLHTYVCTLSPCTLNNVTHIGR